ncbi:MAG: class I SAM-dependent methyltransferase [Terracidiphilus sp.]
MRESNNPEVMQNNPTSPACPVCNSSETNNTYTVTSEQAAQHFVLREADAERHNRLVLHIDQLWQDRKCGLWRCSKCQFGFPFPYAAGDASFYNLSAERTGYPADKWEYRRTLEALEESGCKAERALEVGAGYGLFLDKIVDKYVPRSGVIALEFNQTSIAVLRQKGYNAIQEDIRSADLLPGYDVIFLFQVVEHMDNLDQLFSRLSKLAAKNGRVFISVPNPKCVDFQEESGSLLDMPPNHIGRWSRLAFEIITARAGFTINAIEVEPFSLATFIRQDIVFSYLRKAQQSGTILNWSRSKRSTRVGKLLGAGFAIAAAPFRIPVWFRASRTDDIGNSIWVELTKV